MAPVTITTSELRAKVFAAKEVVRGLDPYIRPIAFRLTLTELLSHDYIDDLKDNE